MENQNWKEHNQWEDWEIKPRFRIQTSNSWKEIWGVWDNLANSYIRNGFQHQYEAEKELEKLLETHPKYFKL